MSIGKDFWEELTNEAQVTRKYLALVPFDKADFKPAPKSKSLSQLAIHLAEIVHWGPNCITHENFDFKEFKTPEITSSEELLKYYDSLLVRAEAAFSTVSDEELEKDWTVRYGENELFTLPKRQVARILCLNHQVHHRAQLGVYLRLLDIPIPAIYGPSADDDNSILMKKGYQSQLV